MFFFFQSRAFYNSKFPSWAKFMHDFFGYESMLPMNSGAEAVETALKIARRWAYEKKGVPENEAIIITCEGCFHGRTITIVSMSSDPDCFGKFGILFLCLYFVLVFVFACVCICVLLVLFVYVVFVYICFLFLKKLGMVCIYQRKLLVFKKYFVFHEAFTPKSIISELSLTGYRICL